MKSRFTLRCVRNPKGAYNGRAEFERNLDRERCRIREEETERKQRPLRLEGEHRRSVRIENRLRPLKKVTFKGTRDERMWTVTRFLAYLCESGIISSKEASTVFGWILHGDRCWYAFDVLARTTDWGMSISQKAVTNVYREIQRATFRATHS